MIKKTGLLESKVERQRYKSILKSAGVKLRLQVKKNKKTVGTDSENEA